jgi:hypothetical protein
MKLDITHESSYLFRSTVAGLATRIRSIALVIESRELPCK